MGRTTPRGAAAPALPRRGEVAGRRVRARGHLVRAGRAASPRVGGRRELGAGARRPGASRACGREGIRWVRGRLAITGHGARAVWVPVPGSPRSHGRPPPAPPPPRAPPLANAAAHASPPARPPCRDAGWDLIKGSGAMRAAKALAINCAGRRSQHQARAAGGAGQGAAISRAGRRSQRQAGAATTGGRWFRCGGSACAAGGAGGARRE